MNGNQKQPHFILVPFMAQGHMIPMVDLARLLADRAATVTLVTTPVNAARIKPTIDQVRATGLPIRFLVLDFPSAEAGLPEGCENIDLVTNQDQCIPFFGATALLRKPLGAHLQALRPRPTCIVADSCNWWTADLDRELDISRLIFHGPSCFYLLGCHNIRKHKAYDGISNEFEQVTLPGLPHDIKITKAQEPGSWFEGPGWENIRKYVRDAEEKADGVVVNTFYDLEPDYVERYQEAIGKVVLPIGPVSLYSKDATSKVTRGNKASVSEAQIINGLDQKDPNSVLYVSFGSLAHKTPSQIIELGHGLEASNVPFIWVMKDAEKSEEVEEWMSTGGFLERSKGRGLVITGWAPQVVILSHPSVGGFMTHCGWNSVLESVSAGVPMITWPHFGDQFLNAKLVVDVVGIGVGADVKVSSSSVFVGDEVMVKEEEEEVEELVWRLMGGGEEAEGMRRRARELGEKARRAMEEGGSSYESLSFLIDYVTFKLAT